MCTVSWAAQKGGYRLLFNRDEQRHRAPGEPPRLWKGGAGEFLGPRDPAGEGTWIGVNAGGWTFALLNFYERAGLVPAGRVSRGRIICEVAGARSREAAAAALAGLTLADFAPFHLLAVDPEGGGWLQTWDGKRLTARDGVESDQPITTSSVETERVIARRTSIFRALTAGAPPAPDSLPAFHRHYDQTDGAASVCMRREDAETVSLSDISVQRGTIVFQYFARDPHNGGFLRPVKESLKRT